MGYVAVLLAVVLVWVLWSSLRDALRKPRTQRSGAGATPDAGAETYLLHSMLYADTHHPAPDTHLHHGGAHDAGSHDAGGFDAGGHDAGCSDAGGGDAGGGGGGGGGD